jgi:hypothetical protein
MNVLLVSLFGIAPFFFYGGLDSPGSPRKTLEELSPGLVICDYTTHGLRAEEKRMSKDSTGKTEYKVSQVTGDENGSFGAHFFCEWLYRRYAGL